MKIYLISLTQIVLKLKKLVKGKITIYNNQWVKETS
jgi:hypothetical protein